jgi:glycosyltransferase involved in cell wall biosynthesis/predicted metal-dependent phosphoesterase TrpH
MTPSQLAPGSENSTSSSKPVDAADWSGTPRRADLHCHSLASNKTSEVALNAIGCPESYSPPAVVYEQARNRGMDFATLTDHDTIAGALQIAHLSNVLIGEELTCWFPEDQCKIHLLIWGIDQNHHEKLQALAANIYDVAEYVERHRIAHSVAHPIYRQNERLERWHLERLLLMFKGFECLNGAHSGLHREAFEPVLDRLDQKEIARLSATHDLQPRWPEPWKKSRTAGSDDHGLLNVGRTWTEFPPGTRNIDEVLACLRNGHCRPGGEAGSSPKLAHTFYSVAVRYFTTNLASLGQPPSLATALLETIVGQRRAPSRFELLRLGIKYQIKRIGRRLAQPFRSSEPTSGTAVLRSLFIKSARKNIGKYPGLRDVLKQGLPPLGEHEQMFSLVSDINRDISAGLGATLAKCVSEASFTGVFDTLGAAIAHQFVQLPYYFACFHQNKERHLLREITRRHTLRTAKTLRVGLFTDTLDEINGVARFIRDMGEQAKRLDRQLTIHTCTDKPVHGCEPVGSTGPSRAADGPGINRKNFQPLLSCAMPYYGELKLHLPPLLEIMEWADRQQFDAIHVSTPGPMGLCGWVIAKMLRVPLLGTYHTDFPAYVENFTKDHRATNGTVAYMEWFYGQMATVFSRSREYLFNLQDLGIPDHLLRTISPGVNTDKFNPRHRGDDVDAFWKRANVNQPHRLLYVGRVSVEKNLPLLADAFEELCKLRHDTALVIAGNGPYLAEMKEKLAGLPVHFLGYQNDQQLGRLYACSDLFVFPSRTDTLGQVVMEAQASGLPVIVSDEGGPKEMMSDGQTGLSLPATDAVVWARGIDGLLKDPTRRAWMSGCAHQKMSRNSLGHTFESFWAEHLLAAEPEADMSFFKEAASAVTSSV